MSSLKILLPGLWNIYYRERFVCSKLGFGVTYTYEDLVKLIVNTTHARARVGTHARRDILRFLYNKLRDIANVYTLPTSNRGWLSPSCLWISQYLKPAKYVYFPTRFWTCNMYDNHWTTSCNNSSKISAVSTDRDVLVVYCEKYLEKTYLSDLAAWILLPWLWNKKLIKLL